MSEPELGLRELKKQITRDAIADAALELTQEKGLDAVTIEEIANRAIVSPRTVSNYFTSKEEAVIAAGSETSTKLLEDFANRPRAEAPLQALREVLTRFMQERTPEQLALSVEKMELQQQYPSLQPFQAAYFEGLEEALRDAVAEHTGIDPEEMYPALVAAAGMAALRSAMRLWARTSRSSTQLVELIDTALNMFSDGLPVPAAHDRTSA